MKHLTLLALLLLVVGLVEAAPRVPMPTVGTPAQVTPLDCDGQTVEVRFYDFTPPDDNHWMATGLGLPRERNFVLAVWTRSAGESDDDKVYVDANRDGYAETVVPFPKFIEQYGRVWCVIYQRIRRPEK